MGNLGGAERSLLELLAILADERPDWKVHLITGDEGPLVREAMDHRATAEVLQLPVGIKSLGDSGISGKGGAFRLAALCFSLPGRLLGLWAYIRKLGRRIDQFQPDIIHSNGFKFHVILGLLGKVQAKTIWHARDFISSRRIVGKFLRNACRMPDVVVANSRAVAADWKMCIPAVANIVLHNSVSIPSLDAKADGAGNLFGPNPGHALRVGLVGSYAKWKGHQVFLEAVRILAPLFPPEKVQFFVIGGPLYATGGSQWTRAELEKLADSLGILDRVGFFPHQTDVGPVYRGLDLVIHASTKPEPFGRTIVEGMAYGKAVVAALDGGVAEIIDDGKDALAFRLGNYDDMAQKIAMVLRDQELRTRLGVAGRQKALEHFSRQVLKGKVVAFYEKQIGAGA